MPAYLKASNPGATDGFGISVGTNGRDLVVGAYREDTNGVGFQPVTNETGTDSGAVYAFGGTANTWKSLGMRKPVSYLAAGQFGFSVAMGDGEMLVGARNTTTSDRVVRLKLSQMPFDLMKILHLSRLENNVRFFYLAVEMINLASPSPWGMKISFPVASSDPNVTSRESEPTLWIPSNSLKTFLSQDLQISLVLNKEIALEKLALVPFMEITGESTMPTRCPRRISCSRLVPIGVTSFTARRI